MQVQIAYVYVHYGDKRLMCIFFFFNLSGSSLTTFWIKSFCQMTILSFEYIMKGEKEDIGNLLWVYLVRRWAGPRLQIFFHYFQTKLANFITVAQKQINMDNMQKHLKVSHSKMIFRGNHWLVANADACEMKPISNKIRQMMSTQGILTSYHSMTNKQSKILIRK